MLKVIRSKAHNLFLPLLFWLLGIYSASCISFHWSLYALVSLLALIFCLFERSRTYTLLLLFSFLAFFYSSSYKKVHTNDIRNYLSDDREIQELITYKVNNIKYSKKNERYYIIDLIHLNNHSFKGKVFLYNAPDTLKVNHIYQTPMIIRTIAKTRNPAEFDYRDYYSSQGIYASASAFGLTRFCQNDSSYLQQFKAFITHKLSIIYGQHKAMALALFTGDRSQLNLNQDLLSEMGILHLFAVSGLHVGIIYFTLLTIFNVLFSLNRSRIFASLLLIFYAYLCSWSPSVFRTILIIIIYNFALVFQRKISFLQLISLTVFIITIYNPNEIFSVGLQLSLTAFIALWIADRKIIPLYYKFSRKYPLPKYFNYIVLYLLFSLSVITLISPLSAFYFNIISFNAIITNFLVSPLITLMLNIILFSLFLPTNSIFTSYLSALFSQLTNLFYLFIDYADTLPLYTRNITFNVSDLIILVIIVLTAFLPMRKYSILKYLLVSFAFLFLILKTAGLFTSYYDHIICFAAGKADCSYLEFSDRKNLLIDTGSHEQNPVIVRTSLIPYLKKRHITSLDLLIITHPHEDHYGGLAILTKMIKVKEVVIHQTALTDSTFAHLLFSLNKIDKITVLQDTCNMWDNKIQFLHPNRSYISANMNNNSLVTMISYPTKKLLFTGDIEQEAETLLVSLYGNKLNADFLKIPHHGSITSSTSIFLQYVKPTDCFIPSANSKDQKFPNPLVLERLQNFGINVHTGHLHGAYLYNFNSKNKK